MRAQTSWLTKKQHQSKHRQTMKTHEFALSHTLLKISVVLTGFLSTDGRNEVEIHLSEDQLHSSFLPLRQVRKAYPNQHDTQSALQAFVSCDACLIMTLFFGTTPVVLRISFLIKKKKVLQVFLWHAHPRKCGSLSFRATNTNIGTE